MISQNDMLRIEEILRFWFGRVEDTIIPTEHRARVWFGDDPVIDNDIREKFQQDLEKAVSGQYAQWESDPRGCLALIIILDQFSRHIYRNTPNAFQQDEYALKVCINGIQNEAEHDLSLIERVFFYFPLLHSERLQHQEQAFRGYQILAELAFSETRVIFDSFVKFSNHHYTLIRQFGRFPQRNGILGRTSTDEELSYLKDIAE